MNDRAERIEAERQKMIQAITDFMKACDRDPEEYGGWYREIRINCDAIEWHTGDDSDPRTLPEGLWVKR